MYIFVFRKMKRIRRLFGLFLMGLMIWLLPAHAQLQLSENAKISILTSAPYQGEVFTVFGHAAFRVSDPAIQKDWVFNYGIFDFSQSNFILRFALGETDYILGVSDYQSYVIDYQMRGSDVTEQVLNLTQDEKNRLFNALVENQKPENRMYRYNFFFDNCATRLPEMVERYTDGKVIYNDPPQPLTFREMVHDCTGGSAWLTFGVDLALGSPADRLATPHEMMFLPFYVKDAYEKATIVSGDGTERKMVSETTVIDAVEEDEERGLFDTVFTPMVCGWLLFAWVAAITFREKRLKKYYRAVDIILFTMAGLAGCVLFFLCFVSVHPSIWPNWSVVWLHPFHLIGVVLFSLKKAKKAAYYYHFINFAALSLFLLGWYFIPQQMNPAFIPLIATLGLRSASAISKRIKE